LHRRNGAQRHALAVHPDHQRLIHSLFRSAHTPLIT
jgi:hypothetical protein